MKTKFNISRTFSLSCLLAGVMAFFAVNVMASDPFMHADNDKDKGKKASDNQHFTLNIAMPKTNLSLDGSFRYSGTFNSSFRLTPAATVPNNNTYNVNLKAVTAYTKGNVTYVVPSNVQVQSQPPGSMNFQKLQIILPLKKG
ncbi:hypothetical protein [Chitinophaga sp. 212800010-3]|uniref:hypothetical protein n=1 Tax=unclassified Chitinophaga TaxID=2619133 RepID=UPI002DEB6C7E|nr:CarboxypepD-reg-like domain-containing protein [Chitinophaga sp. 212800010-3]